MVIPTYEVGEPNKNPMFLEKRVYQGSSGKVYPLPVIDKIYDEKVDKTYHAVYLENEYVKIMLLPELGGKNPESLLIKQMDMILFTIIMLLNRALVGLCGPWISGGIEFNWPQHHDQATYFRLLSICGKRMKMAAAQYMWEKSNICFVPRG